MNEIPKGPTGKLQRIGLADWLKDELAIVFDVPISESEQLVANIFKEVIGCECVGRMDNFFSLGGDSLDATKAHLRLSKVFGVEVQPTALFKWPSVALIAENLERLKKGQGVESILNQLEKLPEEEVLKILEKGDSEGD